MRPTITIILDGCGPDTDHIIDEVLRDKEFSTGEVEISLVRKHDILPGAEQIIIAVVGKLVTTGVGWVLQRLLDRFEKKKEIPTIVIYEDNHYNLAIASDRQRLMSIITTWPSPQAGSGL